MLAVHNETLSGVQPRGARMLWGVFCFFLFSRYFLFYFFIFYASRVTCRYPLFERGVLVIILYSRGGVLVNILYSREVFFRWSRVWREVGLVHQRVGKRAVRLAENAAGRGRKHGFRSTKVSHVVCVAHQSADPKFRPFFSYL